ncbi:MAG TPA: Calx-beta domain-containing protein [Pirellulales bacterium]|jgi:hypothetical protein
MSVFRYLGRRPKSSRRAPKPTRLTFESLESRALVTADLLTSVPLAIASTDSSATATPQATAQAADTNASQAASVSYTLKLTDNNDQEITGPIAVGQTFWIDVFVDDPRTGLSDAGVVSASLNVNYDKSVMTPTGTIDPGTDYPVPNSASHGNTTASPGTIQNLTGSQNIPISGNPTPLGSGPILLDRIQMTANAVTGANGSTIQTAPTPSDTQGNNSVFVNDLDGNPTTTDGGYIPGTSITPGTVNATIVSPVTAHLTGGTATAGSAATSLTITASLSGAVNEPVTIHYQTQLDGTDTAVAGKDFTSTTSSVQLAANQTTATFNINIPADTTSPGDKTFHVAITGIDVSNSSLVTFDPVASEALGTVHVVAPAPTVTIAGSTVQAQPSASTMSFNVHLTNATDKDTIIDYSTQVNGTDTAVPGTDFTAVTGQTLTIAAGQTDGTITITTLGNTAQTATDKTFHVQISLDAANQSNATLGTGNTTLSALGTITNEPAVVIGSSSVTPNTSAATTMSFLVTLVNEQKSGDLINAGQDITIHYTVSSTGTDNAVGGASTNTPGVDYQTTGTTQTLVIPQNSNNGTIKVPIAAEIAGTGTKTFHVTIQDVSAGAFVGTQSSATGTINLGSIPKPVVSIQSASLAEPSTTQNMTFTVTLSAPSSVPVTVNYSITPGTALANTDYTPPTNGTVTFAANQTTATITVPILPDANVAPSAQFKVSLTAGDTNSTVSPTAGVGVGTINTNGSFSGSTFIDTNNDAIKESGEQILSGVTITMTGTTSTGQAEQLTTTSAADGSFSFSSVPPGTYTVTQTSPSGYLGGSAHAGTGANVVNGSQLTFTITSGDTLSNNSFSERGLQPQLITRRLFLASNIH